MMLGVFNLYDALQLIIDCFCQSAFLSRILSCYALIRDFFILFFVLVISCMGSVEIQWGYAYRFAIRNKKNFLSATPLRLALKSLTFALKDSAKALEDRLL